MCDPNAVAALIDKFTLIAHILMVWLILTGLTCAFVVYKTWKR